MKEQQWEDADDGAKEFFDPAAALQSGELGEPIDKRIHKQRVTELRRRAEERKDWKRITGEYDFDAELDTVDNLVDEV